MNRQNIKRVAAVLLAALALIAADRTIITTKNLTSQRGVLSMHARYTNGGLERIDLYVQTTVLDTNGVALYSTSEVISRNQDDIAAIVDATTAQAWSNRWRQLDAIPENWVRWQQNP